MIIRNASSEVKRLMEVFPAVVVLGSRQCGKSTVDEVLAEDSFELSKFWWRGGYPDSYLAADDGASELWNARHQAHRS